MVIGVWDLFDDDGSGVSDIEGVEGHLVEEDGDDGGASELCVDV